MKNLILLLLTLVLIFPLQAQKTINQNNSDNNSNNTGKHREFKFMLEVKQLGQFFARFNMTEDFAGNKLNGKKSFTMLDSVTFKRSDVLRTLFDAAYYQNNTALCNIFINSIIQQNILLSFDTSQWWAEVNMDVLYKSKTENVDIALAIETYSDNSSEWLIKAVNAPFLNMETNKTDKTIHPMSHETNFIELSKIINTNQNLMNYTDSARKTDILSIFAYLIKNNEMKHQQTNRVVFLFQLDNWMFTVSKFKRDKNNSGWLIAKITKIDNKTINHSKND